MSRTVFVGQREYFPKITKIPFEGMASDNPLAFKVYDPECLVARKTMEDWLRFAVCYWHTFTGAGQDQFGAATRTFPWDDGPDPKSDALRRMDAAFEFFSKLGVPFFCFHDRDLAPEQETLTQTEAVLQELVAQAKQRMAAAEVKLLWGTTTQRHPGAVSEPQGLTSPLRRGASVSDAAGGRADRGQGAGQRAY